ncbi:carbonic anhydrase 9-like isoform X2 [Scaptodrosophila lebanonensis]|nr:carbonic anhydrase 9-like isoform X2 [Scaptodrosophila lebanonensis]
MHIPDTINGEKPYINGGMLTGDFEAIEVHFHWGSVSRKGSEHAINRERFDVEMHIVHKRTDFYSVAAAKLKDGGLAVLCIFLRASSDTDSEVYGLNNIFNQLPRLLKPNSFVSIFGELYLKDILGNLDTDEFYTYNGSLTTPTCNEVVTFTIFTDVLDVKRTHIEKFWALRDSRNKLLINNYRNFMPINGRPIYFRAGQQNIQTMPKSYLAMLLILSKTIIRFYK